jgi:hypothetical protein
MNFVLHRLMKIARLPLTPSLSPSDGERVSEGRVRGIFTVERWHRHNVTANKFHPIGQSRLKSVT